MLFQRTPQVQDAIIDTHQSSNVRLKYGSVDSDTYIEWPGVGAAGELK